MEKSGERDIANGVPRRDEDTLLKVGSPLARRLLHSTKYAAKSHARGAKAGHFVVAKAKYIRRKRLRDLRRYAIVPVSSEGLLWRDYPPGI